METILVLAIVFAIVGLAGLSQNHDSLDRFSEDMLDPRRPSRIR